LRVLLEVGEENMEKRLKWTEILKHFTRQIFQISY